jgi:hypothetical protein
MVADCVEGETYAGRRLNEAGLGTTILNCTDTVERDGVTLVPTDAAHPSTQTESAKPAATNTNASTALR